MALQNRRYNKSGATCSEGSSAASSPTSSVNLTNNNAPKYGTLVPNRVFIGGIPSTASEEELCSLFKKYGNIKAIKIIVDRAGVSKGYGFVTFELEEEAKALLHDADNIFFKERKLNIAPAIKKQPCNRTFDSPISPPPIAAQSLLYHHNGISYTYHNGMAFFTPNAAAVSAIPAPSADPNTMFQAYGPHPPAMMYPCTNAAPPFYMPPQYHAYQQVPISNGGSYMYNGSGTPNTESTSPVSVQSDNIPIPALSIQPSTFYQQYSPTEFCYPTLPPQGMYPIYAINNQEGYTQYCDMSAAVEQQSGNISSEGTRSASSTPTSDQTTTTDINLPINESLDNKGHLETPVVSLLSLQQNGDDRERNVRPGRRGVPSSLSASQESYPISSHMELSYRPERLYNTHLPPSVVYSEHSISRPHFMYHPRNHNMGRCRGRGTHRTYNCCVERINTLPVIPKFSSHFNNNNPAYNNLNVSLYKPMQNNSLSNVSSSGRGGRSINRGNYLNSQASPSPPPAPYSPMTRPYFCPSLTSSPPPQVPQQPRQYYNAPPKRYQNTNKKVNGSNNVVGNGGMNNRGKYRGSTNSSSDKSALAGAGDAPSLLNTPAASHSPSVSSKELSAQVQNLTI